MMMQENFKNIEEFRFKLLIPLIKEFEDIQGKKVLDFGCGAGDSTFALALESYECVGVDIIGSSINKAKERYKKDFSNCKIKFYEFDETTKLYFDGGSFDIITCNGVFEHIHPELRQEHFKEIYRLIKPGWLIVIRGTPNSNFPRDGHTSDLWFVPWLPFNLAKYYVVYRNGGIKKSDPLASEKMSISKKLTLIPDNEWISRGIIGVSYGEIKGWIKKEGLNGYVVNDYTKNELKRYFNNSTTMNNSVFKNFIINTFPFVLNILNISIHSILPQITIIFKKDSGSS